MKHDKKEQILEAAKKLFLANGYEETSLQKIIEESNVSKGGVYYYFSSKDEILDAVIKDEFSALFKDMEDILDDANLSFQEKMLWMLSAKRKFYIERYEMLSEIFLSEKHLLLQYRSKIIVSPLFEPYIERIARESHGKVSIETLRILFGFHEMLFDSVLPYVKTIAEFEKYMDIVEKMSENLLWYTKTNWSTFARSAN